MKKRRDIKAAGLRLAGLLQRMFGMNPGSVQVYFYEHGVIAALGSFVGKPEIYLNETRDELFHRRYRRDVVQSAFDVIRSALKEAYNDDSIDIYYDWSFHDKSAVLAGSVIDLSRMDAQETYINQPAIHELIAKVTKQVEKHPDLIRSFWIHPAMLVVMRQGILIDLEKQLVQDGAAETLRYSKRTVEKIQVMQAAGDIEAFTKRKLQAVYLDWAFQSDRSMIVYKFYEEI